MDLASIQCDKRELRPQQRSVASWLGGSGCLPACLWQTLRGETLQLLEGVGLLHVDSLGTLVISDFGMVETHKHEQCKCMPACRRVRLSELVVNVCLARGKCQT